VLKRTASRAKPHAVRADADTLNLLNLRMLRHPAELCLSSTQGKGRHNIGTSAVLKKRVSWYHRPGKVPASARPSNRRSV